MISIPAGWTATAVAKGLLLTPPGGATGSIQYVERKRPLEDVDAMIAALGAPEGFVASGAPARERGATAEGELAELVVTTGVLAGVEVQLCFGFVLLDDYYARLTSIAYGAASHAMIRDTLRALLVGDAHMLGRLRRRWYRYATPPGWAHARELFAATLTTAGARVALVAALPTQPELESVTLTRLMPDAHRAVPRAMRTPAGLVGRMYRRAAGDRLTLVAFLEDAQFAYVARFEGPAEGPAEADFDALLTSIRPLAPSRGAPAARSTELFGHWAA